MSTFSSIPFIVAAAGRGTRFGSELPKAFVTLRGRPLVAWALDALWHSGMVSSVVVSVPAGWQDTLIRSLSPAISSLVEVVVGGATRHQSVARAMAALGSGPGLVGVHDGVRPWVRPELVARVIAAAKRSGAACPVLPVDDAVGRLAGDEWDEVDRQGLVRVQTPQIIGRDLLNRALDCDERAADEAALVRCIGHPVTLVDGDPANIKVTRPVDLDVLDRLFAFHVPWAGGVDDDEGRDLLRVRSDRVPWRTGFGYDVHRLDGPGPLRLGGVTIPSRRGLSGHSDADVLCHAVVDALLGAAGLGDIGEHFPPGRAETKGMSGRAILSQTASLLARHHWTACFVDSVVVCQEPKLAPHRGAMAKAMADCLNLAVGAVSVKATTTEGLGFCGRQEGIAAHAVVMVCRPM